MIYVSDRIAIMIKFKHYHAVLKLTKQTDYSKIILADNIFVSITQLTSEDMLAIALAIPKNDYFIV